MKLRVLGSIPRWALLPTLLAVVPIEGACSDVTAPEDGQLGEALSWAGGGELRIAREALEREFLLQTSLIDQDIGRFSVGLGSKVVEFVAKDREVLMLETKDGKTVSDTYWSALARFPVTSIGPGWIGFDFNAGIKNVFAYSSDWQGSDFDDLFGMPPSAAPFELEETFIVEAEGEAGRFKVDQAAQIAVDGLRRPTVLRYYIEPYVKNPDYEPMVSPGHHLVGYFESSPTTFAPESRGPIATTPSSIRATRSSRATSGSRSSPLVFVSRATRLRSSRACSSPSVGSWPRYDITTSDPSWRSETP